MSKIKTILLSLILLFSSQIAQASDSGPEVLGVLFYADWCGSCKVLEPAIEKARESADFDNSSFLLVRLDLTDAKKSHQSRLMSHALALNQLYHKNAGATGYMLLVNAETKDIISRITAMSDAKAIASQIKEAIFKASS